MPFNFKIPPRSRWTKKGACPILCTYTKMVAGKRYPEKQFSATYSNGEVITILGEDWVPYGATPTKKQRVCRVHHRNEFSDFINMRLDELERNAEIVEKKLIARGQKITPQLFKDLWDIEFSANPVFDVFELYVKDKWRQVELGELSASTARNNESLKKRLVQMPGLTFEGFGQDFPQVFADQFDDLGQGGLRHYLVVLKAFLRWSYKKKYHQNDDFKAWVLPKPTKREFALKDWQVRKIENVDLSKQPESVQWTRDYFIFLFYTAMRLREPSTIIEYKGESDFVRMFKYKVSKQGSETWVSFKPPENVLEIFDKYEGQLMRFSQYTIHTRLKQVAELAGLTPDEAKKMTPHVARHSFITLAREMGITAQEVRNHTMQTEEVFKIYDHSEKRSQVVGEFAKRFTA